MIINTEFGPFTIEVDSRIPLDTILLRQHDSGKVDVIRTMPNGEQVKLTSYDYNDLLRRWENGTLHSGPITPLPVQE